MVNWPVAIRRNHEALLRIVAMLFAIAGLDDNAATATLPRHLRFWLIRILRPAESAVRRLVIIAARGLVVEMPGRTLPACDKAAVKVGSTGIVVLGPINLGLASGASRPIAETESEEPESGKETPIPAFPLLDPFKRFDLDRRRYATTVPRVRCLSDDWSVPVYMRQPEPPARPAPTPDDPVDATGLCRRLISLKRALDDLDGQARRLARWRAKRDLGLLRVQRFSPMRPGWPPGRRERPIHEIDEILKDLHALAIHAGRGETP